MSINPNNDSFKAEVLAEIKNIQEALNELKGIKRNIVKKSTKQKPAKRKVKRKTVKRKPARKTAKRKVKRKR